MKIQYLLLIFLFPPTAALADDFAEQREVSGIATYVKDNLITLNGKPFYLANLRTLTKEQSCYVAAPHLTGLYSILRKEKPSYDVEGYGQRAFDAISRLINTAPLTCRYNGYTSLVEPPNDKHPYGTIKQVPTGQCSFDGDRKDVSTALLTAGNAYKTASYPKDSLDDRQEKAYRTAQNSSAGMWSYNCRLSVHQTWKIFNRHQTETPDFIKIILGKKYEILHPDWIRLQKERDHLAKIKAAKDREKRDARERLRHADKARLRKAKNKKESEEYWAKKAEIRKANKAKHEAWKKARKLRLDCKYKRVSADQCPK